MKFTADKNTLADAVLIASRACAAKSIDTSLECVLLELRGNKLTVRGYNLETGINKTIMVNGIKDGAIMVDARILSDYVRKIDSAFSVELETKNDKEININFGGSKHNRMNGVSANNFPKISKFADNIEFFIKEAVLRDTLSQIYHAVSQSGDNPAMCGVKFVLENNELTLVASDGLRMALRTIPLEYQDLEFIVPDKTIVELIRNLASDGDNDVQVIVDKNQVLFSKGSGEYEIFSRIIDGKFVNYKRVADFEGLRTAVIDSKEFSGALERAIVGIENRNSNSAVLSFLSTTKVLNIYCKTSMTITDEDIDIEYETKIDDKYDENGGEIPFKISFQPRLLLDAIKNSNAETVKLIMREEINPVKIVSAEDESKFLFVVVPMRTK
ncbi:MAG: DNA polymerase III subunit beta [Oscillospiraceae bacterium]|jgi:DNA polymerase-3 subunit beta|nr:DNA polymerase III subunit beta [Oscillospiraceae bacterium]